eukprot:1869045-Amphidinium_carterae.1
MHAGLTMGVPPIWCTSSQRKQERSNMAVAAAANCPPLLHAILPTRLQVTEQFGFVTQQLKVIHTYIWQVCQG